MGDKWGGGCGKLRAMQLGIAVDLRRKNRSQEGLDRNVERLKEYFTRLVICEDLGKKKPEKGKKGKKKDEPKSEKKKKWTVEQIKEAMGNQKQVTLKAVISFNRYPARIIGLAPKPVQGATKSAYKTLRLARGWIKIASRKKKEAEEKAKKEGS